MGLVFAISSYHKNCRMYFGGYSFFQNGFAEFNFVIVSWQKKHLRNLILRFWGKITIFHSLLSNGYCWKFLSNTEHMWCVARFGTICMIWKTWKTSMEDCYLNSKSSTPSWVLCTLIAWRISYEYLTQVDLGPC